MTHYLTSEQAYTAPKTYRLMLEIGKPAEDEEIGETYEDIQILDIVVHEPSAAAFMAAIPSDFTGYNLINCWIPEDCTEF